MGRGWIGFDLDGTLAVYEGWLGIEHIGAPIPRTVERIKKYLADGYEVRIVTARVCSRAVGEAERARRIIESYCLHHIGQALPVTHEKDFGMIRLYDDRCVQVEFNTGRLIGVDDPLESVA